MNKLVVVILTAVFSTNALASENVRQEVLDFFTRGHKNVIPSQFWEKESNNSYLVKNASELRKTSQWEKAFGSKTWYYDTAYGSYPSFSERGYEYKKQCVAFAKVSMDDPKATSEWYPGKPVIENEYVNYDISYKYAGKLIAYFGNNPKKNIPFSKQAGNPNHVGFFLEFVYDNPQNPSKIVGFWMVDQNWGGSAKYPNGQIRKHLVMVKGYDRNSAKNYYLIN